MLTSFFDINDVINSRIHKHILYTWKKAFAHEKPYQILQYNHKLPFQIKFQKYIKKTIYIFSKTFFLALFWALSSINTHKQQKIDKITLTNWQHKKFQLLPSS